MVDQVTSLFEKLSPNDFQVTRHYWDTFGNAETETSALWIVKFLQQRCEVEPNTSPWAPFPLSQLQDFYNETRAAKGHRPEEFWFNRLVPGYIVLEGHEGNRPGPETNVIVRASFVAKIVSQLKSLTTNKESK